MNVVFVLVFLVLFLFFGYTVSVIPDFVSPLSGAIKVY